MNELKKNKIKFCFIYLGDELGNHFENDLNQEIIFNLETKKISDFPDFKNHILKKKKNEYSNLRFKKKVQIFSNQIITYQTKIKNLVNEYINSNLKDSG